MSEGAAVDDSTNGSQGSDDAGIWDDGVDDLESDIEEGRDRSRDRRDRLREDLDR